MDKSRLQIKGRDLIRRINAAKILSIILLIFLSFFCGIFYGQSIPRTFFAHPVLTWQVMQDYPKGSTVLPVDTPEARDLFERVGWWEVPATVVGYETVMMRGEVVMLCQLRTRRGSGSILPINPSWIRRAQLDAKDN